MGDISLTTPGSPSSARGRRAKNVSLPRSLPELQQAAALHLYGGVAPARLRFFHQDREMHHASMLTAVRGGDEIVARTALNPPVTEAQDPMQSTHACDFVSNFSAAEKVIPSMTRAQALMSHMAQMNADKPFGGQSSMHTDFVKHPHSARQQKVTGMQDSHIKPLDNTMEKLSTYGNHFQKYSETGDPAAKKAQEDAKDAVRKSVISMDTLGKSFEADTGYTIDYGRPKGWRGDKPEKVCFNDNDSTLTDAVRARPFEGQSTYQGHYVFGAYERSVSARPKGMAIRAQPCGGSSEYRRQYNGGDGASIVPTISLRVEEEPSKLTARNIYA